MAEDARQGQVADVSRLLMQLSWVAQKQIAFSVSQHELTVPQFLTLTILIKAAGDCPMNHLAEATHQDAATMTGIIDRLERLGLVERHRSQEDRRVVLVAPTSQGESTIALVKQARDQMMTRLFDPFDDDTLNQINLRLEELWQLLEAHARQGYDCS